MMNYHLNQNGTDVGEFLLEELRKQRDAGELSGNEFIWRQGMAQWQTLNSVLQAERPRFIAPPPIPAPAVKPRGGLPPLIVVLIFVSIGLFAIFATLMGIGFYRAFRFIPTASKLPLSVQSSNKASAMDAASQPIVSQPNTKTWVDVQQSDRAFRVRQYIEGYQLRGERNPECDLLAQQFLTNWVSTTFGGPLDTNLPSLAILSDKLANDPACQDPVILTISAINAVEQHEAIRRLERAVKGYEKSKHRGYPRFFANVSLGEKLIHDQADRLPVLDAQALQSLKAAFADGSIQPGDQSGLAEMLIEGWGETFRARNSAAVRAIVKDQGAAFQWLELVLQGEHEISAAWRARGGGYVSTVSESGWKGFSEHLAAARKNLTEAWKLHPEWPLAPCRMIYVSLGDSDIGEMRDWFDRTTAAQIDFARAYKDMRWGLRPRWYGDYDSMLAFGVAALHSHRFDTDVPRKFFDSLSDVESEMELPAGTHIYGRSDVWPHLQELYEGYIAEPSLSAYDRDGWRSTYAVVASIAGKYDVAQQQLMALNWEPHGSCLTGWNRDLSLFPEEIAARTGPESERVSAGEGHAASGDVTSALQIYQELLKSTKADTRTRSFVADRVATLGAEQQLQDGKWVDFLPTDARFTGWHVGFGNFKVLPDGALEVQSDQYGHLMYSRVHMGTSFEVRGEFEVVNSSSKAFQAGLVMGLPQWDTYNWYAFRMKRNSDEGDVASFSQHWLRRQILAPAPLDSHTNTFDVRFVNGRISATVDGQEVFKDVAPPKNTYVSTNEFLLGVGAFNDSNATTIRYRQLQMRSL